METSSATQAQQSDQVEKTIDLTLSKTVKGKTILQNPVCQFSYHWNFDTNMGEASLDLLDGVATNINLHPLGLSGELAFMSDMAPTSFKIGGQEVVISRVILDLTVPGLEASAAIMFEDGSIQATDNWDAVKAFTA